MIKNIILLSILWIAACDQQPSKGLEFKGLTPEAMVKEATVKNRWYTQSQLDMGNNIYQTHCLACHNKNAEGTHEWKKTLANGHYPPPPLNGTAHAWHHDMDTLTRTIQNGGAPLGGVMPGFSDKLSASEIRGVIAYFQSFWSDEIYESWLQIGGLE